MAARLEFYIIDFATRWKNLEIFVLLGISKVRSIHTEHKRLTACGIMNNFLKK